MSDPLSAIYAVITQVNGAPYVRGGHSPSGADCSGAASMIVNAAVGRPPYASRFDTSSEAAALSSLGFQWGSAPGALNVGWVNGGPGGGHTAITLPDGTPFESGGTGNGPHTWGPGAFNPTFTNHMHMWIPTGDGAAQAPTPSGDDTDAPDGAQ